MSEVPADAAASPPAPGSCVFTGPPAEGFVLREPDLSWRAPEAMAHDIILCDTQYLVEERRCYHRLVERLNSLQAVQSRSQWRLEFDPGTDTVTVHWLRVHRDGKVIDHTDPARFRCLQREEDLERCVVNGGASLLVLLEDIRPGDVLDTAITIHTRCRLLREHFSDMTCASFTVHVGEFHRSYRFRESRPLAWRSNIPALTPLETAADGMKELHWERRGIKPLILEENVPAWHIQGGWIQLSDFSSWQEVATGLHQAWSTLDSMTGLEETVQRIRSTAPDLPGQVEAALRIVQDEIRYLSVNVELGGQIPSAPGAVMRRRFGDCKDKSRLLACLLQALGVNACTVLVHTRRRADLRNWLPAPFFDHAILSYELNGAQHYVDATISMQGGGAERRYVPRFHAGLPVLPEGVHGLRDIQPPPGSLGRMLLEEKFEIDPGGGPSDLFVTTQVTGGDADHLRAEIHHHGMDGVARDREQFYRALFPGLKRLGAMEWLDDREKNAAMLAERFELPGSNQVLPVQYYPVRHSAWLIPPRLPGTGELKRKRPFLLPGLVHLEHIIEVTSPSLPAFHRAKDTVRCPPFCFSWVTKPQLGVFNVRFSLEVFQDEVQPEEMAQYMDMLQKVYATKDIEILVPTGRMKLRRRGQGTLMGQHNSAVALVDQDIQRDSQAQELDLARAEASDAEPAKESRARRSARVPSGAELMTSLHAGPPPAAAAAATKNDSSGLLTPGGTEDFTIPGAEGMLEKAPAPAAPSQAAAVENPSPAPKERRRRTVQPRTAEYHKPDTRWSPMLKGIVCAVGAFAAVIVFIVIVGIMDQKQHDAHTSAYQEALKKSSMDPDIIEAGRLLEAGNAPAAKALFDVAGPRHELSVSAQILGARIDLALGNTERARDTAGAWEARYPDFIELRRLRIEVHTARKEFPQSLRLAQENAAKPDAQSWDLFLLAYASYEAGDYRAAELSLTDYLKLNAADNRARSMLSQLLLLTSRSAEVAPLWKDALQRFPADPQIAALAARHLQDAGLTGDATRTIGEASARFPGSAAVAFQHALLLKASDTQAAFDKFRLAATLDPAWIDPVLNAAVILEQAGHAEAPAAFRQAAERCKDSASLQTAARSLLPLSPRGAIVLLEKALTADPASDEAWTMLASCYEKLGDSAKAEAAANRHRSVLQGR